ncbi:MAG: hypothetical protein COZ05_06765 [Armatimonadetes bacterium CG_4_10_14_3_um_filter_59_10]|nr:MAG: hypothetical protein COZ05_06765 [Armatimonadetes bacterium CG_4_10_14_3_um_filter_59_10]
MSVWAELLTALSMTLLKKGFPPQNTQNTRNLQYRFWVLNWCIVLEVPPQKDTGSLQRPASNGEEFTNGCTGLFLLRFLRILREL